MKILPEPNRSDGAAGSAAELRSWKREIAPDKVVGLVATMGALHEGHRSLIRRARQQCDLVALTIFVNPTQFGPGEDYSNYPRTRDQDLEIARAEEVDLVWFGNSDEMYPDDFATRIELPSLSAQLCGESRPHFFAGVCLIVLKLFHLFEPDRAYFGEKDYQQVVNIERMTRDLDLDLEVVRCPIVREADGLAMSSRNVNLNPAARKEALALSRSLFRARELWMEGEECPVQIRQQATALYSSAVELDYFEVVDRDHLVALERIEPGRGAVICVAATIDGVRLIDNIQLEPR